MAGRYEMKKVAKRHARPVAGDEKGRGQGPRASASRQAENSAAAPPHPSPRVPSASLAILAAPRAFRHRPQRTAQFDFSHSGRDFTGIYKRG